MKLTYQEDMMRIEFEGTQEEIKAQVLDFAQLLGVTYEQAPTPITKTPTKGKTAAKPPTDPAAAAPAAPAPAEPVNRTMMPLCSVHAPLAPANVKPIPAEPSACTKCAEAYQNGTVKGKAMSLDEVKAVAEALMSSKEDGPVICFSILENLGAESLTGAEKTKALDPAKYEDFAKQCLAAMPEAAPTKAQARRSL